MGDILSVTYFEGTKPPTIPNTDEKPTFDSHYGFSGKRKERVSKISIEEMKALRIPKDQRDYCAHILKDYLICSHQYAPIYGLCYPELRALRQCQKEDHILRMKEYEREKRLRIRQEKLKKKKASQ